MDLEKYINAGKIHQNIKSFIQPHLKSGIKIIDIVELIENKVKELSPPNQINNSIAFPTGISLNNVAAHFTPDYKDETILKEDDVCKIDYGVHIDGCIIDSAFTINLNNKYNKILEASNEAVNAIIKEIGVDSKFTELSKISQEIVESYEIEINNKTEHLKIIDNLAGHNILPWKIHGGKLLYGIPKQNDNQVVEDKDIMAIEIFVSNGNGTTILDKNNHSHFMLKSNDYIPLFQNKKTNQLSKIIKTNFKTLPFCPRFLDRINNKHINYNYNLQSLFNSNIINSYPPLIETNSECKIAQFEHTIFISENKKINFSKN